MADVFKQVGFPYVPPHAIQSSRDCQVSQFNLLWWKHQAGLSPSNARLTPHIQACWLINAPSQKCWLLRNKEVAFHHAQPMNQTMPCCREARYSQSSQLHSSCWPVLLSIPFRVPLPPSHAGYTISNHTRTPRADLRQILIALAWSTWYPDIGTEVRDGRFKKDTEPRTTATALVKAHARISRGKQLIRQQSQGYYTDLQLQVPSSACSKNSQLYRAAERTDCSYVVGNWDNNTNLTLWHHPSYRILATPTSFCYCAHLGRSHTHQYLKTTLLMAFLPPPQLLHGADDMMANGSILT